jgi:hypothetical protein
MPVTGSWATGADLWATAKTTEARITNAPVMKIQARAEFCERAEWDIEFSLFGLVQP